MAASPLFAVLFHEYPCSARQMVSNILRHYPESQVLCALDHPGSLLGMTLLELRQAWQQKRSFFWKYLPLGMFANFDRVQLLPRKRSYSWRNLQNFLFDAVEACVGRAYDYLILADSDAMFTGTGLLKLLDTTWDFSCSGTDPGFTRWSHGRTFRQHWHHYEAVAKVLGLTPKPFDSGTMFGLFILSRAAVERLCDNLPRLENHPDYQFFTELPAPDFPFYEAFLPQLLADLGMTPHDLSTDLPGYRNRPHWTVAEYRPDWWFYHPVERHPSDPFRQLLAQRAATGDS